MPVFQGLSEHFEDASGELGEFVEEEYSVVCKTDFARLRGRTSSHHGYLRNGMMGTSEGSGSNQSVIFHQFACHGMNFGGFQALA